MADEWATVNAVHNAEQVVTVLKADLSAGEDGSFEADETVQPTTTPLERS